MFPGPVGEIHRSTAQRARHSIEPCVGIDRLEHVKVREDCLGKVEGVVDRLEHVCGRVPLLKVVALPGTIFKIVLHGARHCRRPEGEVGLRGHVHAVDERSVKQRHRRLVDLPVQPAGEIHDRESPRTHPFSDGLVVDLDHAETFLPEVPVPG